ncbi:MAG: cob(I)yrinic acid a,c-diamide adenosyltransferase [Sphingomonadaceae bacterium]|nr:cob(I)yrinic acid a,c-diamide adenosyltransferase [Sphingomonadaceae bacterium]
MVKLNKIYTRTGDDGTTGLVDGSRRAKHDLRIEAYGAVDEANAAVGLVRLHTADDDDAMLMRIQNDLFDLGADLATPGEDFAASASSLRVTAPQVERLEREIDAMNAALAPLGSFVLPAGTQAAAHLHLARTIVRRAERIAVAAAAREPINRQAIAYLNRLSDHLFVMSRAINARAGGDVLWVPGASR